MQDVHSYIMSHGPSFSVLHPFISGVFRIIGGVNFHEFSDIILVVKAMIIVR